MSVDMLMPARVTTRPQTDPARPRGQGEADAAASGFASALMEALAGPIDGAAAGAAAENGTTLAGDGSADPAAAGTGAESVPVLSPPTAATGSMLGADGGLTAADVAGSLDARRHSAPFSALPSQPLPTGASIDGLAAPDSMGPNSMGAERATEQPSADHTRVVAAGESRPASASAVRSSTVLRTNEATSPVLDSSDDPRPTPVARETPVGRTTELTPRPTAEGRTAPVATAATDTLAAVEVATHNASPRVSATSPVASTGASTPAPNLASQLSGPVLALARRPDGTHTVTMSVNPDTLGPVTVRAIVEPSGIRIELHAAEHAREALRAVLPELRRDLTAFAAGARLDLADGGSGDASRSPERDAAASQRHQDALHEDSHQGDARQGESSADVAAHHSSRPHAHVADATGPATRIRVTMPGTPADAVTSRATPTLDILT